MNKGKRQSRIWYFQDARNHFKEVVRRAVMEGPQTVRIYGKSAVIFEAASSKSPKRLVQMRCR